MVGAAFREHVDVAVAVGLVVLGLGAGWLGAVVGIGGGVVIVPALVLGFGFDTKVAVAASLVAVIATSASAGSAFAGTGQTNLRLALVLEMATTIGGLVGGVIAVLIAGSFIDGIFAVVMLVTAALVFRGREEGPRASVGAGASPEASGRAVDAPGARVGWEERGHLGGAYHDRRSGVVVTYGVVRLWVGWVVSFVAGTLSGLLGVGGGFLKVPAMHLGMKVPIKVAAATSNLMIGVTAVASLFVYFTRGYVMPFVSAPIALGIAAGAYFGARNAQRISGRTLRRILAAVLLLVAVQMGLKAGGLANV